MPDDAALGIAIDQATKLAEKWICQPRPNEDASQWNLDKIDQVARDVVALSNIDRNLLISKATELATIFSAPDIPYQDHSKEVVALGAAASNLLSALLQIALRAHEAGLTGNVNFRIYRDATEYADIISNIETEIQEANRKIDKLQHQISKDRKGLATFTLGVISFDIEFLRKILAQALRIVVDGAIVSVLHLKDILSAARKNADSLLNNVQRLGRSTVDEVKVIGTDIAIATTKAWRSSLILVKRVAKSISLTETRDLELSSDPLFVKVDENVGYKDLIKIIVQEIKTSIGSKYYQSLTLDINKNIYTNLHVNKFHIGIGSSSLDLDQPARAMHKPVIFSLSEKQKLYLQDKYFKDDLANQITNTTDIKFVDII